MKLTQYNFGRKVKEIHSSSISITKQIRYRFTVNLNIDPSALQNSFIVISVKMRTIFKDTLVGRVILGPYLYAEYGKILTPWGRALINRETVSHIFRLYQWYHLICALFYFLKQSSNFFLSNRNECLMWNSVNVICSIMDKSIKLFFNESFFFFSSKLDDCLIECILWRFCKLQYCIII